jgi:hypothetical protein
MLEQAESTAAVDLVGFIAHRVAQTAALPAERRPAVTDSAADLVRAGDRGPIGCRAQTLKRRQGSQVRTRLAGGGRRLRTLGPSPKDPPLAGEPKKASSGSSTPRMRLGPQGDRGAKPAPFYESAEPNIPAASYCGMACPAGTCKTLTIFHDGTHGLSPGTDGSNPLPSSGESCTNLR